MSLVLCKKCGAERNNSLESMINHLEILHDIKVQLNRPAYKIRHTLETTYFTKIEQRVDDGNQGSRADSVGSTPPPSTSRRK